MRSLPGTRGDLNKTGEYLLFNLDGLDDAPVIVIVVVVVVVVAADELVELDPDGDFNISTFNVGLLQTASARFVR
jgi:hypothetical protein